MSRLPACFTPLSPLRLRPPNSENDAENDIYVFASRWQVEEDMVGETWHASLRWVKDAQLSFSYNQAITPNFVMGGESLFDFTQKGSLYGFGGKYSGEDWSMAGSIQHAGQVCLT